MTIKIGGSGCAKCTKLTNNVEKFKLDNNLDFNIEKITDFKEMFDLGVMSTPALLIDNEIVSTGSVLSDKELTKIFKQKNLI